MKLQELLKATTELYQAIKQDEGFQHKDGSLENYLLKGEIKDKLDAWFQTIHKHFEGEEKIQLSAVEFVELLKTAEETLGLKISATPTISMRYEPMDKEQEDASDVFRMTVPNNVSYPFYSHVYGWPLGEIDHEENMKLAKDLFESPLFGNTINVYTQTVPTDFVEDGGGLGKDGLPDGYGIQPEWYGHGYTQENPSPAEDTRNIFNSFTPENLKEFEEKIKEEIKNNIILNLKSDEEE